jgi:hypothetical protein
MFVLSEFLKQVVLERPSFYSSFYNLDVQFLIIY